MKLNPDPRLVIGVPDFDSIGFPRKTRSAEYFGKFIFGATKAAAIGLCVAASNEGEGAPNTALHA